MHVLMKFDKHAKNWDYKKEMFSLSVAPKSRKIDFFLTIL